MSLSNLQQVLYKNIKEMDSEAQGFQCLKWIHPHEDLLRHHHDVPSSISSLSPTLAINPKLLLQT